MFDENNMFGMVTRDRTPFGERLVLARKHAKVTQGQLAAALGTNQSTVAHAETVAISSIYAVHMARVLGVSADWLVDGTGEMLGNASAAHQQTLDSIKDLQSSVAGLSGDAIGLARWFDRLPHDPKIREPALNRMMAVLNRGLELAESGQSLASFRLVLSEPDVSPTPSPSLPVKNGKQPA